MAETVTVRYIVHDVQGAIGVPSGFRTGDLLRFRSEWRMRSVGDSSKVFS